ncbi:MAG: lamin tail domain-containing protein [Bacteroidales bacterium]|nr:lamin tail domain-containing protein [Bacteroidales bacterium]
MKTKYLFLLIASLAMFATGCVEDEVFVGPPTISNLTIDPQAPGTTDEVTVTAKVTDLKGVAEVTLMYKVGSGAYQSITMTAGSNYQYTGKIPPQAPSSTVQYYITASNISGLSGTNPEGAPSSAAAYTVGAPSIVINEIFSRGVDPELDWIEVYNNSDVAVNISGYKIYDSGGQSGSKAKMEFPAGTILPARGFYAIVVDDAATAFPAGSNFGLSSGGEEVWLESSSGFVIDDVTFPAMTDATYSYGRKPDGSTNWFIFTARTKGTSNNNSPTL